MRETETRQSCCNVSIMPTTIGYMNGTRLRRSAPSHDWARRPPRGASLGAVVAGASAGAVAGAAAGAAAAGAAAAGAAAAGAAAAGASAGASAGSTAGAALPCSISSGPLAAARSPGSASARSDSCRSESRLRSGRRRRAVERSWASSSATNVASSSTMMTRYATPGGASKSATNWTAECSTESVGPNACETAIPAMISTPPW